MSGSKYNWARVQGLNYLLVDRDHAPDELNTAGPDDDDMWAKRVDAPWALFLGEEDGLIIEGDIDEIADRIDDIQRYVHRMRGRARQSLAHEHGTAPTTSTDGTSPPFGTHLTPDAPPPATHD
ncbi:MAG: hypothetical protein K2X52_00255 [Mycobacteriaceae bacterium]|jgi:hypothetical protein|nr:hypothetical protein [Mycobacteriaceae bacterium]